MNPDSTEILDGATVGQHVFLLPIHSGLSSNSTGHSEEEKLHHKAIFGLVLRKPNSQHREFSRISLSRFQYAREWVCKCITDEYHLFPQFLDSLWKHIHGKLLPSGGCIRECRRGLVQCPDCVKQDRNSQLVFQWCHSNIEA